MKQKVDGIHWRVSNGLYLLDQLDSTVQDDQNCFWFKIYTAQVTLSALYSEGKFIKLLATLSELLYHCKFEL